MALRFRTALGLAALTLVAAGHTPGARPVTVSYETVAKRADLVLQEISQKSGVAIESTEDAKLHYLVVSVKDADVDTLLQQIAKVTSSQVVDKDGKKVLQPDAHVRILEKQNLDALRTERFKKAQDWVRTELNKKPVKDENGEVTTNNYFGTPGDKALAQLVLLINPREAANLGNEGRIVFSNAPNRMQKPLGSGEVVRILATLVTDHNKYADEQAKQRAEMKGQDVDAEMQAYMQMFGDMVSRRFDSAPAKAVLVIEFQGAEYGLVGDDPQAKLKVYDQKGEAIVQAELSLNPETQAMMEQMAVPDEGQKQEINKDQQKPITEADRTPVKLSENSKLMAALNFGGDLSFDVPEPVRAVLRDPVANDPLSFQKSDNLISIAQTKKLNVVANLADGNIEDAFESDGKEGGSVGQAYNALAASKDVVVEEKDGWYVLMPANPISARENRQDRFALRSFIANVEAQGRVSLDDLSVFAMNSPSPVQNGSTSLYMLTFAPTTLQGIFSDTMDWNMLRLYANLLPAQRSGLRQGARLQLGTLSQRAKSTLTKMAFGSTAHIQNAEQMKAKSSIGGFFDLMMQSMPGKKVDYTEEPTEAMPNGLPMDGFLTLDSSQEPILSPIGGGSILFFGFGTMGADELAMYEAFTESSGGLLDLGSSAPKIDKVKLGSRDKLDFAFWLTPAAGIKKTLLDDTVPKDAQAISIKEIPANFRALINKRKQEFKDSPFGKMMAGFGGGG